MKRYISNKINKKTLIPKVEYYRSSFYPKIEKHESDIYVITTFGDRLDSIAYKYYGDTTLWWVIAVANSVGKGSIALDAGLQIRIPQRLESIMKDWKNILRER